MSSTDKAPEAAGAVQGPLPASPAPHSDGLPIAQGNEFLQPFVRRYTYVNVPSLGVRQRIQNLNELERGRVENSAVDARGRIKGDKLLRAKSKWCQACAVDENGRLCYTPRDIEQMVLGDPEPLDELFEGIKAHCHIRDDDLRELEKNSGATGGDGSP